MKPSRERAAAGAAVEQSPMDKARLVDELEGRRCRCRRRKAAGQPFCSHCFCLLPPQLRARLGNRLGQGFEQAYAECQQFLGDKR